MTPQQIEAAAATLLDARRRGVQLPPPAGPAPADRDTVYAIQDAVARALGPVEGWKTGAPNPEAEPNCAPLVAGSWKNSSAAGSLGWAETAAAASSPRPSRA